MLFLAEIAAYLVVIIFAVMFLVAWLVISKGEYIENNANIPGADPQLNDLIKDYAKNCV